MDHWAQQRRLAAIEHLQDAGWLQHVQWLDEIDSTNSLARRLLNSQLPLPALLVADQQTAGRGRAARSWWSPSGCLMLSLVINSQHLPIDSLSWPQLSLVTGVAAAMAVEREVPDVSVQLKWPNDLYVHHRKLAGILVEAVPYTQANSNSTNSHAKPATASHALADSTTGSTAGSIAGSMAFVIGIGMNVAVDMRQAPREIQDRACSLGQFSTVALTMEAMLVRLVEQLELELAAWQAGQVGWWHQWSERSLLTNRAIQLKLSTGQQIMGHCTGIDPAGYLLVQDTHQLHRLQSAEILKWDP